MELNKIERTKKKKILRKKVQTNKKHKNKDIKLLRQKYSTFSNKQLKKEKGRILKEYDRAHKMNDKVIISELEKNIEALKRIIENKTYNNFKDTGIKAKYPFPYDKKFSKKILSKKEFYKYKLTKKELKSFKEIDEEAHKICNPQIFKLNNNQELLKNFISSSTPYNGLLVFHGVGVGKTCTSISLAEQFRKSIIKNDKRIIILANGLIQNNFRKEILNITRIKKAFEKKMDIIPQCTGNIYKEQLGDIKKYDDKKLAKVIDKIIDKNYSIMGYRAFANEVSRLENKAIKNKPANTHEYYKRKIINENYSNTVLILDEAHNIRTGGDSKTSKLAPPIIEKVIEFSKNLKLILLSATPMYNGASEIIFLLNLLLLNDNRPIIEETTVFDSSGNIKKSGIDILKKKSTGYVSYMRGENPINFPIRLYPSNNILTKKYRLNDKGEDIEIEENFDKLMLYKNVLSNSQLVAYQYNLQKNSNSEDLSVGGMRELQICNITYPFHNSNNNEINTNDNINDIVNSLDIDDKLLYGRSGFERVFSVVKKTENSISYTYKNKKDNLLNNFLSLDRLNEYSPKFASIINQIENTEGVIFIYSQYLYGGTIPLALALEQNGIMRYGGESKQLLTNVVKTKGLSGKYIILTGDKLISDTSENILKLITEKDYNKDAKDIRVIIGTSVAGEGLDFKRVRQVHILEPWYNISKLEQVIGRGIRNCSHIDLPIRKRNVTLFLHTAINPPGIYENNETKDIMIYRKALIKAKQIGNITRILKENAIDCGTNYHGNLFIGKDYDNKAIDILYNNNFELENANNEIMNVNLTDKPFSYVCDFMEECNYRCNNIEKLEVSEDNIDYTTYNSLHMKNELKIIIKKIKDSIFVDCYNTNLNFILKLKELENYDNLLIYRGLNEIVNNPNEEVYLKNSKNGIIEKNYENPGYIIYKGSQYIFQSKKLNDFRSPMQYRKFQKVSRKKKHNINIENNKKLSKPIYNKSLSIKDNKKNNIDKNNIIKSFNMNNLTSYNLYDRIEQLVSQIKVLFDNFIDYSKTIKNYSLDMLIFEKIITEKKYKKIKNVKTSIEKEIKNGEKFQKILQTHKYDLKDYDLIKSKIIKNTKLLDYNNKKRIASDINLINQIENKIKFMVNPLERLVIVNHPDIIEISEIYDRMMDLTDRENMVRNNYDTILERTNDCVIVKLLKKMPIFKEIDIKDYIKRMDYGENLQDIMSEDFKDYHKKYYDDINDKIKLDKKLLLISYKERIKQHNEFISKDTSNILINIDYVDEIDKEIRFDELSPKYQKILIEYTLIEKIMNNNNSVFINNLFKLVDKFTLKYKDDLHYDDKFIKQNHIVGYKLNNSSKDCLDYFRINNGRFTEISDSDEYKKLIDASNNKKNKRKLGDFFGYIEYSDHKKYQHNVFKFVTSTENKKTKGMRCEDFSQKKTVIDFIKLLDPAKYDDKTYIDIITELSKYSKDKNNEYYKNTSCNILHKLLRIKDKEHAKKWFFDCSENYNSILN